MLKFDISALKALLSVYELTFNYVKQNGEETTIRATLKEDVIKANDSYVRKTDRPTKKKDENSLICFALDRLAWRSLRPENIKSVTYTPFGKSEPITATSITSKL